MKFFITNLIKNSIYFDSSLVDYAVCKGHFSLKTPKNEEYHTNSIFAQYLKISSTKNWFLEQFASLNDNFLPQFAETFNRRGSTFSFNLFNAEDMFRSERCFFEFNRF